MARQFKIWVDMDGVLCDFDSAVKKLGPKAEKGLNENATVEEKQAMYDAIEKAGEDFWANEPWTADGKALWIWLSQYNPILLTSPGKFTHAVSGKIQWVKKNIPGVQAFYDEEKWRYAERNSILIDDNEENIIAWNGMGGVGILHKDFDSTKNAVLLAIRKISPSRADNQIMMDIMKDIHKSLMAKRIIAYFHKDFKYL